MSIKILIADKLASEGATYLKGQPEVEVIENTGLTDEELVRAIADVDGIIVRSAVKLPQDVLEQAFKSDQCNLKGIARAGVGVDNIDLKTATKYEDLYNIIWKACEKDKLEKKHFQNISIGLFNVPCGGFGDILKMFLF